MSTYGADKRKDKFRSMHQDSLLAVSHSPRTSAHDPEESLEQYGEGDGTARTKSGIDNSSY